MDQLKERWPESHLPMSLELIRTSVAWVCPAEQMKALDEGTGLGHLHSHAIGCLQGWRDLSKQTNKQTKQNKQTNSRDGPLDSWLSHSPKWRCACSHQRNSRGEIPIGLSGELTISPPLKKYIYISFKQLPDPESTKECACHSGKNFFLLHQHWEVVFRTSAR